MVDTHHTKDYGLRITSCGLNQQSTIHNQQSKRGGQATACLLNFTTIRTASPFWLVCGLVFALHRIAKEDKEDVEFVDYEVLAHKIYKLKTYFLNLTTPSKLDIIVISVNGQWIADYGLRVADLIPNQQSAIRN